MLRAAALSDEASFRGEPRMKYVPDFLKKQWVDGYGWKGRTAEDNARAQRGFQKQLEVVGTGYRVAAKGTGVEFALGFSHPVNVEPPAGITFTVEGNNKLTVSGISKQAVGEVAANIRKLRKPEPYKGKGVRYAGEQIRRKAGKAGK